MEDTKRDLECIKRLKQISSIEETAATRVKRISSEYILKSKGGQENIPLALQKRIAKTYHRPNRIKVHITIYPNPLAVRFKNLRRGGFGAIRNLLRHSFLSWPLLQLSFIRGSVLEILKDNSLKELLTAKLRVMGIVALKNFDVYIAVSKRNAA